jgi:hypothetical protein
MDSGFQPFCDPRKIPVTSFLFAASGDYIYHYYHLVVMVLLSSNVDAISSTSLRQPNLILVKTGIVAAV